jgi:hypothetical protein
MDAGQKEMACYLAWNIWKARNLLIFENLTPIPQNTVAIAQHAPNIISMPQMHNTPHKTPMASPNTQTAPRENIITLAAREAYGMTDASLDAAGHTGVVVAFFYETGALQFVYFAPATTTTTFQAEATAMEVALREWQSPFFQKPKKIFHDCKQLVDFLKTGEIDQLPCW